MNYEHELYTDLLTVLRDMVSHYHRILELSQRERESLTAASLPILLEITTQKETTILELSVMEEGRQLLLRKLAEQLDIPVTELTLRKLSQLAPEPLADGFRCSHTNLLDVVQAVSQVNAKNVVLLSFSLNSVRTSLSLISRLLDPAPIYGNNRHLNTTGTGGKVLHQQI